ncbi:hypothetical protein B0T24DRAFT_637961 [Lasiosphaeria ovina]|uniref:RBR-type E3 ubiquitin transferase n=1 Tax=Lasiosphaeria ovina TaxID=92902 RepID=A0AAE0JXD3_9PEZI|nr:hypothetical protein B0T24DRAFT_637961 [Lasiosphaeria ovina]
MPHNPQSNDTVEADAALALALAHAEFRDVQMQRDRLLAYSIAHGTADDNDFELAYRLTQQMDDAIASFNAAVPSGSGHRDDDDMTAAGGFGASESTKASGVGGDSWMFWDDVEEASSAGVSRSLQDREQQQLSIDLCHALRAAEAEAEEGEEASLAAARRLQEQFDLEDRNDEGLFSEWKAANMEGCVACGDELLPDDLVRPPSCGHGFCDACLVAGFRAALASKTPFQCCGAEQRLAVGDCLSLPVGEKTQYEDMVLELTTPNPTYCSAAKCAAFVSPRFVIGDIATCQRCAARTCRHCNRPDHPGAFCKEDTETEAVKKLGLDKGWKTCPGCGHLIERTIGCLHMVCAKCQTAFCYRCSKRWRDCESTCPDALSATHPKKYVGP